MPPACPPACPCIPACLQNALDNVSNKVGVSGAAQDEKDASQLDPFRWAGCSHLCVMAGRLLATAAFQLGMLPVPHLADMVINTAMALFVSLSLCSRRATRPIIYWSTKRQTGGRTGVLAGWLAGWPEDGPGWLPGGVARS
jgi:hypothetical protein